MTEAGGMRARGGITPRVVRTEGTASPTSCRAHPRMMEAGKRRTGSIRKRSEGKEAEVCMGTFWSTREENLALECSVLVSSFSFKLNEIDIGGSGEHLFLLSVALPSDIVSRNVNQSNDCLLAADMLGVGRHQYDIMLSCNMSF